MKKIFGNKKVAKNPHKPDCILHDKGDFTIIQNSAGLKISDCHKKIIIKGDVYEENHI